MKQRIIATKISITRQGEIKFFQVKIPFDAQVITGIETAMRLKTFGGLNTFGTNQNVLRSRVINPGAGAVNSLVGELKLQSCDDSNVFYAVNVTDPTVIGNFANIPAVNFMAENAWTHGCKKELEKVLVDGNTTVLSGLYKDKLGEMLMTDVSYDVFVYVWYKFETKENDNQPCP